MTDPVNHPAHYNQGGMECYEALEACMGAVAFRHMLHGDAMAYLWRLHLKGDPLENAQKARRCLDRWIQSCEQARAELARPAAHPVTQDAPQHACGEAPGRRQGFKAREYRATPQAPQAPQGRAVKL